MQVVQHHLRAGRAQLVRGARSGRHADARHAGRPRRHHVRRHGRRRSAGAPCSLSAVAFPSANRSPATSSTVRPRWSRCSRAAGPSFDGDHHAPGHRARGPRPAPRRAPGSGSDGVDRVRRVQRRGTSAPPPRPAPAGTSARVSVRSGGPSRDDRQVGVDVHAGPGGQRPVRGGDAGPGVDQGHVEVEADRSVRGMPSNVPGRSLPSRPAARGARNCPPCRLAWKDDDHLTRRPPAVAARRAAGRAPPAAAATWSCRCRPTSPRWPSGPSPGSRWPAPWTGWTSSPCRSSTPPG